VGAGIMKEILAV